MPRDGSNIYRRPAGTDAVTDTTIESAKYNAYVADVEQDLNLPRPIVAGGTGASTATAAMAALNGEIAKQVIVNYSSDVFVPGSFYSATTATGSPFAGHAFAGICYAADATNMVIQCRDITDANHYDYLRVMSGGVWGAFSTAGGTGVLKAGDTMTGLLILSGDPSAALGAATKQYSDLRVLKGGDTMTGLLVLSADPAVALGAATRQYVDSKDALDMKLAGGQTTTGGFGFTLVANGNLPGSFTPNPLLGNYQSGTNNGAHTWNAPAIDCAIDLLLTNSASAGTITFSGYTFPAGNTGDSLTTTNGQRFIVSIRRMASISTFTVKALQ